MSFRFQDGPKSRGSPFNRGSASATPSPAPLHNRAKSTILSSPLSASQTPGHARHQSFSPMTSTQADGAATTRLRSNSHRSNTPAGGTFAPKFIKSAEIQESPVKVQGIEGENDFSGKRYVWLRDDKTAFVRGWVVEELDGGRLLVQCDDGTVSEIRET